MLYAISLLRHRGRPRPTRAASATRRMMKRIAAVEDDLARQERLGPVARLMPVRTAKTLRKNQRSTLRDGPFAETKEQLLGFFVVECATEEEAIDAAEAFGQATSSDQGPTRSDRSATSCRANWSGDSDRRNRQGAKCAKTRQGPCCSIRSWRALASLAPWRLVRLLDEPSPAQGVGGEGGGDRDHDDAQCVEADLALRAVAPGLSRWPPMNGGATQRLRPLRSKTQATIRDKSASSSKKGATSVRPSNPCSGVHIMPTCQTPQTTPRTSAPATAPKRRSRRGVGEAAPAELFADREEARRTRGGPAGRTSAPAGRRAQRRSRSRSDGGGGSTSASAISAARCASAAKIAWTLPWRGDEHRGEGGAEGAEAAERERIRRRRDAARPGDRQRRVEASRW